ncbi:MAG: hypothetical protein WC516_03790 [Patescibacteria group bacterium]
MQNKFLSILNIIILCLIVFAVSVFFVENAQLIGFVLVGLSIVCVISLIPFGIKLKSIQPDIMFGIIDNGILAIMAVIGGHFAGAAGAIIGGVVGNAITDAIAGIFEGYSSEKCRTNNINEERTILKSAVGKMAGCLFGAGIVLIFFGLIKF